MEQLKCVSDSDTHSCFLNPWLKCKNLCKKFKKKRSTNNMKIFNNTEEQLVIKCPNCHRKSVVSLIRCTSFWQLSSEKLNKRTSANKIIRSSSNTLVFVDADSERPIFVRSPSNYCRVATCEKLHIHDLTPKCLETFAPSSTCSSCQHCDRPHIGPNHDQLLMVKSLLKELPLTSLAEKKNLDNNNKENNRIQSTSLLMQWPLPEYRPQHSPDHLYRSFQF